MQETLQEYPKVPKIKVLNIPMESLFFPILINVQGKHHLFHDDFHNLHFSIISINISIHISILISILLFPILMIAIFHLFDPLPPSPTSFPKGGNPLHSHGFFTTFLLSMFSQNLRGKYYISPPISSNFDCY